MGNWRNSFTSPFMASWDIDKPTILTIESVEQKVVQLQKSEQKVLATFVEKKFDNGEEVKKMILNASNCKILHKATNSNNTDNWKGIKVEIGVIANKGRIGNEQGLSILRVLSSSEKAISIVNLVVGDENWEKVLKYVQDNKHLGLSPIVKNLQTRYSIDTLTKKKIGEIVG